MFIDPMLLATAPGPFSDPRFLYEPKIDGHRLIFSQESGNVRLYTRHNNDCTRQYPEIAGGLFPHDIILDGEIACVDPMTGVSDFEAIMSRFQARRADKIARLTGTIPAYFAVFDALYYNGQDLRKLPLMKRKEILAGIPMPNANISVTPHVEGAGEALFAEIQARGMEGVVGKRADSVYETGRRSDNWRKVINWTYADVYITGYKKAEFGWLAGIEDDRGGVRPAGIIEFGVGPKEKNAFYGVAQQIVVGENSDFVFMEPRLRARVKMRNWTKSGLLRSPVFERFIV
ncbi:ATP-dependent DNA ligase [Paenibacillus sp. Marseille-P2973]|uniref:ATP-dependent DNA ligase n=1 Tax=Paenibacillus sp. Marseille-P2973 TaxID=1871032 RepID=UPI001B3998C1|nr:ATP-dependent DNA ligase [Paenibacillus sp. Marseille-P2973]MBQ4899379.1 ATP-dependent DNA ligase [Paenibacillus sp. Marseille-P2973]